MAAIEVEKKFTAPDYESLSKCVKEGGGTDIGTKSFTDVYYDTSACVLTRKDTWLRCRDGAWELKLPVEDECTPIDQTLALCSRALFCSLGVPSP